ncbi:MAG: UvrD-helicase domain-containing protein [Termitinemataceae bacterium]|nr:MAG: UvrD-helicase domain-containing protein [Termitinemataceae bacterium]
MNSEEVLHIIDKENQFDSDQRAAVTAGNNVVVTAGAGSGKTKVLSARFAYLIIKDGLNVDEILTMTFTKKAAAEMSERIYKTLYEQKNNPHARKAVEEFNKANIVTFDSFCTQVARIAAPRYGIAPDFTVDNKGVAELAQNAALPFVLKNRENTALQNLICEHNITKIAHNIFAASVLNELSSITTPLDCYVYYEKQLQKVLQTWREYKDKTIEAIENIKHNSPLIKSKTTQFYAAMENIVNQNFDYKIGNLEDLKKEDIFKFLEITGAYCSVKLPSSKNDKPVEIISGHLKNIREYHQKLVSLVNTYFQFDLVKEIFSLMDEFQKHFNKQKRSSGILTFNDIASLALKALIEHPDIRDMYKRQFKAVMCDEFQDNNNLQKNLLFLLAENMERKIKSPAQACELINNKLFFVGDEKQSIYKFRGADVSVFRSLIKEIPDNINLAHNYRSDPALINSFNYLFDAVFLKDSKDTPLYEAVFTKLYSKKNIDESKEQPLNICFLKSDDIKDNENQVSCHDAEAVFVAKTIYTMVKEKTPVRRRSGADIIETPCTYKDFAVLQRSYSNQNVLEKQFKAFGIPYNAEKTQDLFYEAVVNDMLSLIRLIVYPHDSLSYAAFLRSPFVRFDDKMFLSCMFNFTNSLQKIPFSKSVEAELQENEIESFRYAADFYNKIKEISAKITTKELITKLWEDYGYKHETLNSAQSQIYGELYDYLFEMAKNCDDRGKNLSEFLDHMDAMKTKSDELDVPLERKEGVALMSVHKSKGLEFPVVFVFGCSADAKALSNSDLIYFDSLFGPCFNLPAASEELISNEKIGIKKVRNYFFDDAKYKEQLMETAELRRLLYVAMTRAESKLFISAALSKLTKKEKEMHPEIDLMNADEEINLRCSLLIEKRKNALKENYTVPSFLDLLLPALVENKSNKIYKIVNLHAYTKAEVHDITAKCGNVHTYSTTSSAFEEKLTTASELYEKSVLHNPPLQNNYFLQASKLQEHNEQVEKQYLLFSGEIESGTDELSALLRSAEISAADFGIVVHNYMEALVKDAPVHLSPSLHHLTSNNYFEKIIDFAKELSGKFLDTDLYKLLTEVRLTKPNLIKTEYSFLSLFKTDKKNMYVSGQIDLLFAHAGTLYIVDYKTDKSEVPQNHAVQLSIYKKACADIFPEYAQSIKTYLFYTRSGHCINIDDKIYDNVDTLVLPCSSML